MSTVGTIKAKVTADQTVALIFSPGFLFSAQIRGDEPTFEARESGSGTKIHVEEGTVAQYRIARSSSVAPAASMEFLESERLVSDESCKSSAIGTMPWVDN